MSPREIQHNKRHVPSCGKASSVICLQYDLIEVKLFQVETFGVYCVYIYIEIGRVRFMSDCKSFAKEACPYKILIIFLYEDLKNRDRVANFKLDPSNYFTLFMLKVLLSIFIMLQRDRH